MNVGDVVTVKGRKTHAQVVRVLKKDHGVMGGNWSGWVEVDPALCGYRRHAVEDLQLVRRAAVIVDGRSITEAERMKLMAVIEREDDGLPQAPRQLVAAPPKYSPAALPPGLEGKRLRAIQWLGHRWLLRDPVRRR